MDLGGWLRGLGLEQYEAAFRENAIDDTVLHDLTEDHLREIGIPLGARLKLLKAIAALGTRAEATRPSADAVSPGPPADTAERRQVTVMFSDLVGSTALSARMDPEDLRESFRPIRSVSARPCGASAALYRSTWAMGCWFTSATQKPTRTMQSGLSGRHSGVSMFSRCPEESI